MNHSEACFVLTNWPPLMLVGTTSLYTLTNFVKTLPRPGPKTARRIGSEKRKADDSVIRRVRTPTALILSAHVCTWRLLIGILNPISHVRQLDWMLDYKNYFPHQQLIKLHQGELLLKNEVA